jgi:hypothetical protein
MAERAKVKDPSLFRMMGQGIRNYITENKDTIKKGIEGGISTLPGVGAYNAATDFVTGLSGQGTPQAQATPAPQSRPVSSFGPNSGYIRNEGTGDVVAMVNGKMGMYNKAGESIDAPTRGFRQLSGGTPPTATQTGPYQVSGLTGDALRQERFNNPTRPGTRMRSGGGGAGDTIRAEYFARNQERLKTGSGDPARDALIEQATNSPIAKERIAAQQTLAAIGNNERLTQTDLGVTGLREQGANARTQITADVSREGDVGIAGLRDAQTRQANAAAEAGQFSKVKIEVPSGEVDPFTKEPIMTTRELLYDRTTGRTIDPYQEMVGRGSGYSQEDMAAANKYFGDRTDVTKAELDAYLASLRG